MCPSLPAPWPRQWEAHSIPSSPARHLEGASPAPSGSREGCKWKELVFCGLPEALGRHSS